MEAKVGRAGRDAPRRRLGRRAAGSCGSFPIQRFNPGRAIARLARDGFVLRDTYYRRDNVALTAAGFIEAWRLGGVRGSEIVDLDRVTDAWTARGSVLLGGRYWVERVSREDGPSREVSMFAHVE